MKTKIDKIKDEAMKIEVAFPECVHVELVQSNDLKHYEIFIWLSSLFASATSGFWVSFATTPFSKVLFATSMTFSLFTIGFGWTSYFYRTKITETKLKKVLLLENFNTTK